MTGGFDFESFPMLKKPMEAIGETINVPGNFWDKCPAADKQRNYKCWKQMNHQSRLSSQLSTVLSNSPEST